MMLSEICKGILGVLIIGMWDSRYEKVGTVQTVSTGVLSRTLESDEFELSGIIQTI